MLLPPRLALAALLLSLLPLSAPAQFRQSPSGNLADIVSEHDRRLTRIESELDSMGRPCPAEHIQKPSAGTQNPHPSSPANVIYRVKPGESLGQIARRHLISTAELARMNRISDPDQISVGQLIQVPNQNQLAAENLRQGAPAAPISERAEIREPVALAGKSPPAPSRTLSNHIVRKGDTLFRIASEHGISTSALRDANGLFTDHIHVGQRLRIPSPDSEFHHEPSSAPVASTHLVKRHETASAIARRYGISVDELARANSLDDPTHIYIGQSLTIPGGSDGHDGLSPAAPARADHFATYRVRRGNTVTSIARDFEISPQAILDANNLSREDTIHVGQDLKIPVDQFFATLSPPGS